MEKNDPTLANEHAKEPLKPAEGIVNSVVEPLVDNVDKIPADADKLVDEAAELAKAQTADQPETTPLLAEDADVIPADDDKLVDEAAEAASEPKEPAPTTMAELIEIAKNILQRDGADISREAINRLRSYYNTLSHNAAEKTEAETPTPEDEAKAAEGEETQPVRKPVSEEEETFKQLFSEIKAKKADYAQQIEAQKAANLQAKNDIIAQILALAEDTDNVNRTFPRYRELQDQFNAIGEVPATDETTVWKRFQEARERYSDNLKINKELRDYDFKKNLESKELLIAEAHKLNDENDIITAFKRLQDLHAKWREIGPVAKELREEIWQKFKDASAEVSKRYQTFFEERKAREVANEQAKTALCVRIEALDFSSLSSFAQWDAMTAQIIEAQNEWKKLGFASRKLNTLLFNRFRATCDKFFAAKAEYFKSVKEQMAKNLERKTALAEKAESLKDSTEWKKTTDLLVEMQKEWKTIGTVAKKHSDAVWKRFQSACDHFFEQKKAATSGVRQTEHANLQAKRDLIAELDKITPDTPKNDVIQVIQNLQSRWKEIGHVPFREKDKVYEQFRSKINEVRKAFDLRESRERMDNFESNISALEGDQGRLMRERERLARILETRRTELRTYENNLGFLSAKSKSGNSLVKDFERKIERLKDDIKELQDKIKLLDSKL